MAPTNVLRFTFRYEALGLEVHFTEVDVGCVTATPSTTQSCLKPWSDEDEQKKVRAAVLAGARLLRSFTSSCVARPRSTQHCCTLV